MQGKINSHRTLINFLGMRKVNTRGIQQANKCMLMAATAFNLKKLLKYAQKPPKSCANLMKIATKTRESLRFYLNLILGLHTCHLSNLKI